ncbi:MAG: BrnA antitoxin family protein, partial [candidate division NC10 bacterium]
DFSKAKRSEYWKRMPPLEELDRHTKVRITIMLDLDILKFFKGRAGKPGGEPYQTQINTALREYIEGRKAAERDKGQEDERFISRLAERVAEYVVKKQGRKKPAGRGR